jgi:hypothetical protein
METAKATPVPVITGEKKEDKKRLFLVGDRLVGW